MPFDPTTARPSGFDPATAKPAQAARQAPRSLYESETLGEASANLVGAALEPMATLASGAIAAPIAGLAGIVTGVANKLGISEGDAADVVRSVAETLTYRPVTQGGKTATEAITYPFARFAEGAEHIGGNVAEATGSPMLGTVVATAPQAALIAGGAAAGGRISVPKPSPGSLFTRSRVVDAYAGRALRGARNLIDPYLPGGTRRAAGRTLVTAAGERSPAVMRALERPPENPLNIPQSAGQAAAGAGSAEFSALQKAASERAPSPYLDLKSAAESARVEGIRRVGRTPEELQAAIKKRGQDAETAYGNALAETVAADADLSALLSRVPRKALTEAMKTARLRGEPFGIGTPKAPVSAYPVRTLHYIKMALDDMVKSPQTFGIGGTQANAIGALRGSLVEWLGKKSPRYDAARVAYQDASLPINQMRVGQALEAKLGAPLVGERASVFSSATKEAASTIKKSTGQPRYRELSEVLNKEQMQVVDALVENLRRDAAFEQQARAGGPAMRERLGLGEQFAPATGFFSPIVNFTRGLVNRLSGKASDHVLDLLADVMKNPAETARLMRHATPQEKAIVAQIMKMNRNRPIVGGAVAAAQEQ